MFSSRRKFSRINVFWDSLVIWKLLLYLCRQCHFELNFNYLVSLLTFSDSDGIVLSLSDYLTLTTPWTLQFTVEVWMKGNSFTGNFITAEHNSATIFSLSVSGSDLIVSDVGSTFTFTGAFSSLSSSGWNLLGVSFGLSGDATNTGVCCLWVGNNALSKCLYQTSSAFYTSIIGSTSTLTFKIG